MPLHKLSALGSYEDINGGAHRKAASIVGIPCLVRRLGFWNTGFPAPQADEEATNDAGSTDSGAEPERKWWGRLEQKDRARAYDTYLSDLQRLIDEDASGTFRWADEFSRYRSHTQARSGTLSVLRFWWRGMLMIVRVEYHTEYMTITSIADLSVQEDSATGTAEEPQLRRLMRTGLRLLGKLFGHPLPDHGATYRRVAFLQEKLWKEFEESVLDAEVGGRRILAGALGQVFADFRGMVGGSSADGEGPAPAPPAAKPTAPALRQPFESALPRRRDRPLRYWKPPEGWAHATLRRLWPLMESAEFLRDYEFTVGGFLGGRALYVSALGPQPPANLNSDWPWTPVYYYIHSHTDDEWQIGRLLDRINTLGTMRLAATMEIASLIEAGLMIDRLATEIGGASRFLQMAIKEARPLGRQGNGESAAATGVPPRADPIDEADLRMLSIQNALKAIDDTVSGSIAYRLERSKYYLDQFRKGTEALRERRIEGYQKYEEFVMRRMSETFGYIELLHSRMEAINSSISKLNSQYASLKIASVTCSIDGLVASLRQQDKEIGKIQEFGEVALIGAIIPYYVGISLFTYLLALDGLVKELAWLVLITCSSGWVLMRVSQQRKDPEARDRLRPIARFFRAYLIGIWALFLTLETFRHGWHGLWPP